MRKLFRSFFPALRAALTLHPTPEDAASVVRGTFVGVSATALNAVIYAVGAFDSGAIPFLTVWLGVISTVCVAMAVMSRRAARKTVTRVSRRAGRRLVQTSVVLALPWAVLAGYVIGLGGPGRPGVVLLVCMGMLAGGAFMLHRAFVAAISYMVTILAGLVLSVHVGGLENAWMVTAYGIVYGGCLGYFAFRAGETARERDASFAALTEAVDSLERAHDENYLLANIDEITGLLNRKAFNVRLRQAVDEHEGGGAGFALLLMDLDRFKNVNDLFGHGVGDDLLAEIARRLRCNLSGADVVGRLGGDEFAILLTGRMDENAVQGFATRVLDTLNRPARLAGRLIHPGASLGAVICPEDGCDPEELMLKADLALNRAKETGRGRCVSFDHRLRQTVIANDRIEAGLRAAFKHDHLHIEYQPKVALHGGQRLGAEALVRWTTETGERVPPDRFLAIAAERGLLPRLSRFIAQTVAGHIADWRKAGLEPGKIALNLHPDDLKSPELFMETIEMFEAQGVTGRDLILEITEGCFVGRGTDRAAMILDELAGRGYALSLDDFGTGHASLSHLKRIPVAEIKIDRSFVAGIGHRRDDRAIVAATAEIARGMEIRSVAEGVETEAQRDMLQALGVEAGQGYLWARPMSAERYATYLAGADRPSGAASHA